MPELLRWVSFLSVLVPITFLLIIPPKKNFLKILGIILFVSFFTDLGSLVIGYFKLLSTPLVNFYTLIEFILLSLIYQKLFLKKYIVYVIIFLFTIFFAIDSIYIEGIYVFQSYTTTLESVIFIIYSVRYYIHLYKTAPPSAHDILNFPPAWINAAVFFYFSFDLFFFIVSNYVFTHMPKDVHMTFWSFHSVCNIIKNIFFAVGIYYAGKKQRAENKKILQYNLE